MVAEVDAQSLQLPVLGAMAPLGLVWLHTDGSEVQIYVPVDGA